VVETIILFRCQRGVVDMKHKATPLLCILSILIMSACGNDDKTLDNISQKNNSTTVTVLLLHIVFLEFVIQSP
jgi:hypothetical protein